MNINETRSRIKSRVWQNIAQARLDLQAVPKESLDDLLDIIINTVLLELDDELGNNVSVNKKMVALDDQDDEQILWEGRPLLSLNTQYIVTNERIRIVEGILGKSREDIELVRVQDIDQSQNLSERMLNIGDITIRSHDPSHPSVVLRNIKDPVNVHEILRRAVLKARDKHRLIYRENM